MLSTVLLLVIFLATTLMTLTKGIGQTFVCLFVPVMLFLNLLVPVNLPGIPDLSTETALGYGVMAGCLLALPARWKEISQLRLNLLDIFILLMMIPPGISVFINDSIWDAISKTGQLFFRWVMPYFLARVAFLNQDARRALLPVLCVSVMVLGFFAAVEARLMPYFITRAMEQLNLAKVANSQVFYRFGLMRAQTSLGHPIDLGNMGVILGGLIIVLTPIAARRFTHPLVVGGILGAGAMVVGSVSFTGLTAMAAAFFFLFLFSRPRYGAKLVLPAVIGLICFVGLVMSNMLTKPIPEERPTDPLEASVWIRIRIIQEGWEKAINAGLFGEGQYISTEGIGTGSIDNAYILFVMQYGWGYLVLWIVFAILIGWYAGRTLQRTRLPSERFPVAALSACLCAIFLAMYTVYFGFVYAVFFLILVGILSTMYQIFSVLGPGYAPVSSISPVRTLVSSGPSYRPLPGGRG